MKRKIADILIFIINFINSLFVNVDRLIEDIYRSNYHTDEEDINMSNKNNVDVDITAFVEDDLLPSGEMELFIV